MARRQLDAKTREKSGTSKVKKLRNQGLVPGVLYGKKRKPVNVKLEAAKLSEVVGGNQVIDLNLDNDTTQPVMVKEVQRDVIKGNLLHVDFYQVDLEEEVTIEVPIELAGPAVGEKEGGVLEQLMRELEVACLPTDIPAKIEANVSELEVGQSLNVGEIETKEDIKIVSDPDATVATVVVPEELDLGEAEEEEEEEMEEPEVIGEAEEEEEELEEETEEEWAE